VGAVVAATGRSVALLVNPAAAGGRVLRVLPRVEARLRALGVAVRTEHTESLDHARALARAAAARGDVCVTLSGDGLVGAVAEALRETPGAVLGVIPGGRGNDFARVLGIPLDAVAACDVIAHGAPRPIDVGDAEGRTFIGIASVGFDSDANRIANAAPAWLGRLVYAYGALRALATWRPAAFAVEVDGRPLRFTGFSVAAANAAAYGGGMLLAPGARLDDGALDVVLVARTSRLRFLRALPKVFRGAHVREPSVTVLRGAEVRVRADRPFTVYADGDPIGILPITLRAVPGALRVLLPTA
jgi:YegS/Rv2252/BmrU family lipid kinase